MLVAQLCLTLCDPLGCSLFLCPWNSPGRNIGVDSHSLLQAISWPRDQTQVSCVAGRFIYHLSHQGSLWTEEPGGLQSMGSQRIEHHWATNTYSGKAHTNLISQWTYFLSSAFTRVPVVRTGNGMLVTCVSTLKILCASKSCPVCPFMIQRTLPRKESSVSKILGKEWLFTSYCNKNIISSVSLQPSVTASLV